MDTIRLLIERYRKAFNELSKKNPLRRMTDDDRAHLIACLVSFVKVLDDPRMVPPHIKELEKVHDVAEDARSLAGQIRQHVFQGAVIEAGSNIPSRFKDLPAVLTQFADELSSLVGVMGGRGQKHKASPNDLLVQASEIVKASTGGYNDEHLVELLWLMFHEKSSGEAIQKRRQRTHPERYAEILKHVRPK